MDGKERWVWLLRLRRQQLLMELARRELREWRVRAPVADADDDMSGTEAATSTRELLL